MVAGSSDGPLSDDDLLRLVDLLQAVEEVAPLRGDRLARLARQDPAWRSLVGRLAAVLEVAVGEGVVLRDQRQRLTARGRLRPVQLYRLNYRHPRVVKLVGPASESTRGD